LNKQVRALEIEQEKESRAAERNQSSLLIRWNGKMIIFKQPLPAANGENQAKFSGAEKTGI
jgi:hypothetical protein